MTKKKKYDIKSDELVEILINKMLEKHNISMKDVMGKTKDGEPEWYQHYTFTTEESSNYKEWFINFFKDNVKPKMGKKQIEKFYLWFDVMWGLRIED